MIALNLFRQYIFCPRIVYFKVLTDINPHYPYYVKEGNEYHDKQELLSKNRKFKKLNIDFDEKILNSYFEDKGYDICGIVDLAIYNEIEIYPIEFKLNLTKNIPLGHKLQLYGYGLLLSKEFNKISNRGFIIYSNNSKAKEIEFNASLKNEFFKVLDSIKKIIDNGNMPFSSATENKCSQCEYINFCNDRF